MFKPYRQIEETEEFTVYEFKTIYIYILYSILGMMVAGQLSGMPILWGPGLVLMFFYGLVVSTQYWRINKIIKRAMKKSLVGMSGSKWSFSSPFRVRIEKAANEKEKTE